MLRWLRAVSLLRRPPTAWRWAWCSARAEGPSSLRRLSTSRRRRPPPVSYTHLTLPTICSV
eukprot:6785502-Alexandrium_andersonii.AAC.1